MSPKVKCHQNKYILKTGMSPKLNGQESWNVSKTKSYQNWNVTKKFKWTAQLDFQIKLQKFDTDFFDFVYVLSWTNKLVPNSFVIGEKNGDHFFKVLTC